MAESQCSLRVLIPLITDKNVYLSLVQPFGHSNVFHLTFILGEFFFLLNLDIRSKMLKNLLYVNYRTEMVLMTHKYSELALIENPF